MLRLQQVALARGTRVLYRNVTLTTSPGETIGLVGPNGCGKSTLFAAILGEIPLEAGDIDLPAPERIAHVAQSFVAEHTSTLSFVLSGHAPLVQAKKHLARLEAQPNPPTMRLASAIADLAELNEGAIRAQAKRILTGLGFQQSDFTRDVYDFSGGWRNRIALARALMCPADLLLLDEPTNHLDIDSLIWLENWLKQVSSTVIIISHDREFLDRSVRTIWSIENETIRRYSGNYTQFESLRLEKLRQQDAAARAYEREAAHLQSFIDRFRAKATKARQAQSRIKMLERLKAVEPVRASREWRFRFAKPERLPENLLQVTDMAVGYGDTPILMNVKLHLRSGERIGILGVNGAGKSTLIKALVGRLPTQAGEIRRGQGLRIGYFAQHQLDALRMDETPLDHMRRLAPEAREQEWRDHLGGYRFSGDFATQKVGPMSGGEKARLALALIAWKKPNLLVLDEPTNHLDMETREALTMALSTFEGSVLLVSHDRHLLRAVTDQLWLIHQGKLTEYEGDLDDYAQLVLEHRKARHDLQKLEASSSTTREAQVNKKEARRLEAQERARIAGLRKPLVKKLEQVEKRMSQAQRKLAELDAKLADSSFYETTPAARQAQVTRDHGTLTQKVARLERRWLELTEEIEAIQ